MDFIYDGDTYFSLQYNGNILDTATGIDKALLMPNVKYFCYFQQGQNAGLVDGVTLTGQTSGAVLKVKDVVTTGGAVGSSDATGVLLIEKVTGTLVSGENLRVSTTTYAVAASGLLDTPFGMQAKSLMVSVETNTCRFFTSGLTPTSSTDTPASYGIPLLDTTNIVINGWKNVNDFKIIHAVEASNAVVHIEIAF